jgi:hypothetical protein
LLSRQSILSEQKSEQEEIKKRLIARFPGPRIFDHGAIVSLFTEEELEEPMLAPIKERAAIEQAIHSTLVEIKEICTEISFDGFIEKLFRRGKSPQDYSNLCNKIAALLLEKEVERAGSSSRKGGVTRRRKTSDRDVEMAVEYLAECITTKSSAKDTTLKWHIGKRYKVGRSTSNTAINNGLQLLGAGLRPDRRACKLFYELHRGALLAYLDQKKHRKIDTLALIERLKPS